MNTLLVLDKDSKTKLSEDLKLKVVRTLEEKGHRVEVFELGKNDVSPCLGCLPCLIIHKSCKMDWSFVDLPELHSDS